MPPRRLKIIAVAGLALALMPSPLETRWSPPADHSQRVTAQRLHPARRQVGEVRIDEAWQLDSTNSNFGGTSALVIEGPRQFLLASDFGTMVRIHLLRDTGVRIARIWPLWLASRAARSKAGRDLESLTVDPATGQLWGGFEHQHRITRFLPGMANADGDGAPAEMQRWNPNGGAEAMVRLGDGRFIVLAETSGGPGGGSDALLFARDPVADPDTRPIRFALDPGGRGRVTDAALLPDGRVLLLFRDIDLTKGWISTLAVADPDTIRSREQWQARTIARFERPQIAENFEGLAVEPQVDPAAPVAIWMVSDDNLAGWQRTLLVRLLWAPPRQQ